MSSRRRARGVVATLLAVSLLAIACSSDETVTAGGAGPVDDLAAFCDSWQDMAALVASEPEPTAETFAGYFDLVDELDPVLPRELAPDWAAFVGFNRTFRDLLVTVGYDAERVDDDLVARAFGDIAASERASRASEAAFASIEDWAATGCGDFCTRWPELRATLDELGFEDLNWVAASEEELGGQENGRERLARLERVLALGTELAPEGARADWRRAVAARADWLRWWEAAEFVPEIVFVDVNELAESELGELVLGIVRAADYIAPEHLSDFIVGDVVGDEGENRRRQWATVAAWQAGSELPAGQEGRELESELLWAFRHSPDRRHGPIDARLQEWVAQNCETAGAPGQFVFGFREAIDGAAGNTVVVSLLPRGGSVVDLLDPSRLRGSWCEGIGSDPWEPFWRDPDGEIQYVTQALNSERPQFEPLCWHGDQVVFAGGDYTLVAAVFPGSVGGEYGGQDLPPPTRCLELDVTVAGDAELLLPAPEPCAVSGWPDDLVDDPWRNPPPIDPDTPGAGTLKVMVRSLLPPEQIPDEAELGLLSVVAVPAGTTLNDIGREEVWPLGGACVHLRPAWHYGEDSPEIRLVDRPNSLPLGPLPVTGNLGCLSPEWLAQAPPDEVLPLATLPPGEVTVTADLFFFVPGGDDERYLCATVDAVVDGDTVVELPALEECETWR